MDYDNETAIKGLTSLVEELFAELIKFSSLESMQRNVQELESAIAEGTLNKTDEFKARIQLRVIKEEIERRESDDAS